MSAFETDRLPGERRRRAAHRQLEEYTLKVLGEERSASALRRLLESDDGKTRAAIIRAFANCPPPRSRELLESARNDPSPTLRWVVERLH